ncbi:hypothetical protein ACFZCL_39765 [Streptomyces sp. NPDC008159]|uniref:hypothetical protein n=1 Tax=Streptomyces sp. NPDC008159 TaxID=3364817 RepID=UPI0036EBBFDB
MPFFFVVAVLAALGLGLAMWNRIMIWARDQLFPWVSNHLPWLSDAVKEAFVVLDEHATATRSQVKAAWYKLRPYLLEQIIEFERGAVPNTYVRRMTALIRTSLEPRTPAKRLTVEEDVSWDELPEKYRESEVKGEEGPYRMDVTKTRDQELEE